MVVCYIILKSPDRGACICADHYDTAAAAMAVGSSPSECLWIVPGTVDPMED